MKAQTKFKTAINLKKPGFLKSKKSDFNILTFILLYVILLQAFYLYIGLTSTGGRFFSPFLSKYANFPEWLTIIIAKASRYLLELAGYGVYQRKPSNIMLYDGGGVTIAWACLGAGAMSLWVAFIASHKSTTSYKVKWIVAGIVAITVVNILRIIMIVLSNHYSWKYVKHFNAHASFNILTYIIILVFMYVFVRNYNRAKTKPVPVSDKMDSSQSTTR